MFLVQMWKEIKSFFTSKGNLLFMFAMPLLLITIFSFALRDYVDADYGTFEEGRVFYYIVDNDTSRTSEFESISQKINDSIGVSFEQVYDYEEACRLVESSEAYGVITIKNNGYEYFRSSFNEPEGGKLVRSIFIQMAEGSYIESNDQNAPFINKIKIEANKLDSKSYYTFAGLSFSILFMGLLVAFSVYNEKEYGTIERIKIGGSGIPSMIISKVLTGVLCGIVMIGSSWAYSTFVLKVNWGSKIWHTMLVLLCLVIYSAVFGCVIGFIGKNKSMCQSTVLMVSMLCGYLGGSITPLYLLENMPVLKLIIRISPLYYTNRAIISLSNGIIDEKFTRSILVLLGLTILFAVLGIVFGKKVTRKV